jgi:Replication-relaxation
MEFNRLPRFTRASTIAAMRLTERDHQILRLVHQHRFLRSSRIVALVGGSPQHLARRLQLLYHHSFLERPRAQLDYYHRGGSRHIVYGLGDKGTAVLKREPSSLQHSRWGENNRTVGRVFLEHALSVSDIIVAVELACRKNGQVRFISAEELRSQDGSRQPFRWRVNVNKSLKMGVIPDCTFGLEFQGRRAITTRAFFFVEADRGTMPVTRHGLSQTSFFRKLLAYEATWSQKIHQTLFGFHRFRVLTITTSAERLKTLVAACSRLESGQGLFLFADRTILDEPADILSWKWAGGRVGESGSLLD